MGGNERLAVPSPRGLSDPGGQKVSHQRK